MKSPAGERTTLGMVVAGMAVAVLPNLALVTLLPAQEGPLAEQQTGQRAVAVLDPDTVRVGEPFTLAVAVPGARGDDVRFPPLLGLDGWVEQLRAPTVRWDGRAGGWRAYYRLAAWREGDWSLPPISIDTSVGGLEVATPAIHVTSVLPASTERPLQLESPRSPRPIFGFPWWLLLLLLALALAWWLLRQWRRSEPREDEGSIDPADAAREALARLKAGLETHELDLAEFYDGLERVVRHYLAARRGWSEALPVREFVHAGGGASASALRSEILSMEGRAGLVRFAHLAASRDAALRDAEICLEWVDAEEAA